MDVCFGSVVKVADSLTHHSSLMGSFYEIFKWSLAFIKCLWDLFITSSRGRLGTRNNKGLHPNLPWEERLLLRVGTIRSLVPMFLELRQQEGARSRNPALFLYRKKPLEVVQHLITCHPSMKKEKNDTGLCHLFT